MILRTSIAIARRLITIIAITHNGFRTIISIYIMIQINSYECYLVEYLYLYKYK